ncbi:CorA family divalent cation transporter [Denitrificimonas sp. JX-1]|uniref:CorA family divalent cation transporter n=1 Tax=Denitrificimonas halotolerans TaxID=3098930 RepID=A0ABU5GQL8_9GAMM|nr:CorA family divalent cation transporter [Denitrificimonas sp. JX-1]MDY7219025.1 CorA family divalent cation transporter [Denitrificimonas sp. JX-1]
MQHSERFNQGLLHAYILDGQGSAVAVNDTELENVQLAAHESLWIHWDRAHQHSEKWLRENSGLNEFACDLLLEENTRPRLLRLENQALLLFLRAINLNPQAEPEDMISLRIYADQAYVYSLRQRPVQVTDELIQAFERGHGPRNTSELLLFLAQTLTDRVEHTVSDLADTVDAEEAKTDEDERYTPEVLPLLQARRSAANLRRFLAPQRDVFVMLMQSQESWFMSDDAIYWNELNNRLMLHLEELELTRERIGVVLETEQRRRNERISHTMYLLTVITGFFLPLTFVTGLLGINVGGIPGAENPYGFLIACFLLVMLALMQWLFFRWLRWV